MSENLDQKLRENVSNKPKEKFGKTTSSYEDNKADTNASTKNFRFTDSHCHLDFEELSDDKTLLKECYNGNIHRIIVPAVSPKNWQSVLSLAEITRTKTKVNNTKVLPCLGIHPWYLENLDKKDLEALKSLCLSHKTKLAAIGEMGIDGVIAKEQDNMTKQQTFFAEQLAIADQLKLPAIIHHRRSHNEVVTILKKFPNIVGGIVHAFSGSYQQAKQYLDLGFKLGIGGTITYPRAEKTRKTVTKLPLSSIVLETDAPSMPLYGFQGQPNSPLRVLNVFECLSQLRTESQEDLAVQLEKNIDAVLATS